ncbi:MAG: hypothetical protein ABI142_09340, partial [Bryocella sp.]
PAAGGPLPTDPEELALWKTFYGNDIKSIESSNHRNVVPGAWRIEVTPAEPALEDRFLHVFEINDRGKTGQLRFERLHGDNIEGVACTTANEAGVAALFPAQTRALDYVETTLPTFPCHTLWLAGLEPDQLYDLDLAGSNFASGDATPPGVPIASRQVRAHKKGVVQIRSTTTPFPAGSRMRLHAIQK